MVGGPYMQGVVPCWDIGEIDFVAVVDVHPLVIESLQFVEVMCLFILLVVQR